MDIAKGLHYLHSHQVTHFDIKPGNILLTKNNTAKIGDIGFARFLSKSYTTRCAAQFFFLL